MVVPNSIIKCTLMAIQLASVDCFSGQSRQAVVGHSIQALDHKQIFNLQMGNNNNGIDVDFEDDDEAEVGTMRVSELKSELKLRGVDFSDCFDKESLAKKLRDARATGKADPSIIDQFNKQRVC